MGIPGLGQPVAKVQDISPNALCRASVNWEEGRCIRDKAWHCVQMKVPREVFLLSVFFGGRPFEPDFILQLHLSGCVCLQKCFPWLGGADRLELMFFTLSCT